ncbi:carbohydrate kinase [Rodentibacter caecimuris]|uniref:FGGY-family carbohydrate kinase n=1 Tax=Rodentibacter caecimuris TaxID=1796644 RepID=UPI0010944009|nr:FGGY-family carbohydrate kinase [Pasteurella caecimuris]MCR1837536.1 carbohydrate kinase [Pasteurella caecimuris]MCU0107139.1 carbohydrate kinase [Pasteurella caecimuris]TGY50690.1 carbohydrate kinase [Pasteurella caecimuris]
MNYYLGIDCGGTFIKAALFDQQGNMSACIRKNIEIISEKAGYAERDMPQLWLTCAEVIQQTIRESQVNPKQIKGIGISAQGKGAFLLDKQKKPLGRAILSSDQRSLNIVCQWQQEGIPEKLYPITRQTLWTGHPVSILRWIKENEPERYTKIGSILMSHDYLRFCLTGELHCEETNISESNLYNMESGKYENELAEILGLSDILEKMPPIIAPNQVAGYVTSEAAELSGLIEGTPVVGGLFDVISTALCAGLDDEKKLNVVLGTWSVVSGVTAHIDRNQTIPFVYGRYAEKGKFLVHEASPTSAGNLEWFIKHWKLDYNRINKGIAQLPPASSTILFVPFLYGSNAGLGMQAGFYGIQSHHTQIHLMQAVYEGVLFSLMHHLTRMLHRFPDVNILRVTGGPTKSTVWLQMLADLTGMTLEIPTTEETGCLGVALMAMQSAVENPIKLTDSMRKIYPSSDNYQAYQKKYAKYVCLVEALKTLH